MERQVLGSSPSEVESLTSADRSSIARRLLDGQPIRVVREAFLAKGVPPALADEEIESVLSSPIFEAAIDLAWRYQKLGSLFEALGRQLRQSHLAGGVPVEMRPSQRRFLDYYVANRPLVIKGLMEDWPALRLWSPEYFSKTFGSVAVEVTANREDHSDYEENFKRHRCVMTMGAFSERITARTTNDLYLVARNRLLEREEFSALLAYFSHPSRSINGRQQREVPQFWFGPRGTITPLHHDASNILFGQVYGRKRVRLVPPYELENLYNERSCYSAVDLDRVDLEAFPRIRNVLVLETVLEPGDFLFIPIGWWHWLGSLDVSISLSFQNFAGNSAPTIWRWKERSQFLKRQGKA